MKKNIVSKYKKCLNCSTLISRYAIRCHRCAAIERNKDLEYLKKQSIANRGQKRSEEAKRKMSKAQKRRFKNKRNHPNFGKHICIGRRNGMYIDGRTSITFFIRHCTEAKNWKKEVFKRDNYTCQDCGRVGGKLEVHHIKPLSLLFDEFKKKYNQFSIVEDKEILIRLAFTYEPFWDVNNGKTICIYCHKRNYTTRPRVQKIE